MTRHVDDELLEDTPPDRRILSDLNLPPPDSYLSLALGLVVLTLIVLGIILWIAGSMSWSLFFIFGGIAGLAIFVQNILSYQRCGKLDADAEGLILRPPGGAPKRIRYEDILEIRAPTGWTWQHQDLMHVADLVTAEGVALMMRYLDTEVVEVLWPVLLEKVACPIGDRVLARLRQGKEASFGEVVFKREGFFLGEEFVRWDDVRLTLFTTDGIRLLFRDLGRPEMLLPRQTPNLHAFMHVLWGMRKQRDDLRMGKRDTLVFLSDQDSGDEALGIEEIHERTRFPRVPGFPKKDPDLGRVLFGMKPRKWMTYSMIAAYVVMVGLTILGFTMAVLGAPEWLAAWFFGTAILGAWAEDVRNDSRNMGFAVYEGGIRTPWTKIRWKECHRLYLSLKNIFASQRAIDEGQDAPRKETRLQIESKKCSLRLSFVEEKGRLVCLGVLDAALPELVRRYHEQVTKWGGEFSSGGLTLRRDAILYQGKEYPFDRIRSLSLDAGYCTFKVSSSRAPVATISTDAWNFPIFYALFKKLLAEEERGSSRRGDAERA